MRAFRSELTWLDVAGLAFVALMISVAINAVNDHNDFVAFYTAAANWRTHGAVAKTGPLDLNPPTFSVLFSPLTYLPLGAARIVWTAIGAVALADTLRRLRRTLHLNLRTTLRLTLLCLGLQPAVFAWALGQLTWVLLWLVTRAWLAEAQPVRAGLWLAGAIAIKPPFALMALLLPVSILVTAGLGAATITACALALTGLGPWLEWLQLNRAVDWLSLRPNASLWGLAARIVSTHVAKVHLTDIPWYLIAAIFAIGAPLGLRAYRARGPRRWLLAGLWSLTMSPLGWTYYLPVFIGPASAIAPSSRVALGSAILLMILPIPALYAVLAPVPGGAAVAGAVYSIALGLLWIAWWRAPDNRGHADAGANGH